MISSGSVSGSVSEETLETFLDHEQKRRIPVGNIGDKCRD